MVVFIGNLPKSTVQKELLKIAHLGPGTPLRIVKKQTAEGRRLRYALVSVDNDRQMRRLINRLQGCEWNGHTLSAREYRQRLAANEQRRLDWRSQRWLGAERRCCERRHADAATSRAA